MFVIGKPAAPKSFQLGLGFVESAPVPEGLNLSAIAEEQRLAVDQANEAIQELIDEREAEAIAKVRAAEYSEWQDQQAEVAKIKPAERRYSYPGVGTTDVCVDLIQVDSFTRSMPNPEYHRGAGAAETIEELVCQYACNLQQPAEDWAEDYTMCTVRALLKVKTVNGTASVYTIEVYLGEKYIGYTSQFCPNNWGVHMAWPGQERSDEPHPVPAKSTSWVVGVNCAKMPEAADPLYPWPIIKSMVNYHLNN